jgi:hypothetical protein
MDVYRNVIAAWRGCAGDGSGASSPPSGTPRLERGRLPSSFDAREAHVCATPGGQRVGEAIAAWSETDGEFWVVMAATRARDGRWSQAVQLSAVGADSFDDAVDINPLGQGAVGWTRLEPYNSAAWVAYYDGRLRPGVRLSATGEPAGLSDLALDGAGNVIALWNDRSSIRTAETGTWRPSTPFPWYGVDDLEVWLSAGDAIAAAPERALATEFSERLRCLGHATGSRSAVRARLGTTVDVEVDDLGNAYVVWGLVDDAAVGVDREHAAAHGSSVLGAGPSCLAPAASARPTSRSMPRATPLRCG